jgi:hypothetical protein
MEEELMDQEVKSFRAAAARENRGRRGLQRRYSPELQSQAVRYWRVRRAAGEALRDVAVALWVAPWSLHRWTTRGPAPRPFVAVQLARPSTLPAPSLAVILSASGPRVEGLTLETAAQLLTLLR